MSDVSFVQQKILDLLADGEWHKRYDLGCEWSTVQALVKRSLVYVRFEDGDEEDGDCELKIVSSVKHDPPQVAETQAVDVFTIETVRMLPNGRTEALQKYHDWCLDQRIVDCDTLKTQLLVEKRFKLQKHGLKNKTVYVVINGVKKKRKEVEFHRTPPNGESCPQCDDIREVCASISSCRSRKMTLMKNRKRIMDGREALRKRRELDEKKAMDSYEEARKKEMEEVKKRVEKKINDLQVQESDLQRKIDNLKDQQEQIKRFANQGITDIQKQEMDLKEELTNLKKKKDLLRRGYGEDTL